MEDYNSKKLEDFLRKYSLDDLAKSFFILSLWIPNISSHLKFQYLYVLLQSIHKKLPVEDKIKTYSDFKLFCENLLKVIPHFPSIEDLVPETDWGDIKYYFKKKFHKIFYGGSLNNPYDFYYAYEIIHKPFEEKYLDILERSPFGEMSFCLELQNDIIENIEQAKNDSWDNISPGDIETPSEIFWRAAISYLNTYDPSNTYQQDVVDKYTQDLPESASMSSMDVFVEDFFKGRNCRYFFLRKKDKYYPVMPREWLAVIYDTWGVLLRDNYREIIKRFDGKEPNIFIGIELGKFIRDRVNEDHVFLFAAPIKEDTKPPNELVYTVVHSGDKLFLIHTTPPVYDSKELSKHLKEIAPKLKESGALVLKAPARLGLFAKNTAVEFIPQKQKSLEPIFIIAIPSPLSDIDGRIERPEGIEAEIMTLDQVCGIFDEIEKTKELSDFFEHLEEERKMSRGIALNSYLDRFGSFKDSHGVLVPGAIEPNMIMLDFGWGSGYRFKSLKEFWVSYPEENLFGHPRSWTIPKDRKTLTGMILNSKNFFGYAYAQKVGKSTFHINAPVHLMDLEEGTTADTLMHMIFDAIDLYQDILNKLDITKSHNKVHFFFCSSGTARNNPELSHIKHLAQDEKLWAIDSARINSGDFGIRIVYSKEKVVETLKDVKDRSLQVLLLVDALKELGNQYPEPKLSEIVAELGKEKTNKPRFGMFAVEKRVSFPQHVRTLKPDEREYKLADKEIAKVAHELGIEPGTYTAEDAKEKLNNLRAKVVKILDGKIKHHDFATSLPILFEYSNAFINDAWQVEAQLEATKDHDLDYEVSERSSEKGAEFLHWYRVYRYLIEKFVQHLPSGDQELRDDKLKEILALAERLTNLYVASDFINYGLYPVDVEIDRDYIVSTKDKEHNMPAMEKGYGEEQAKISLGIIGNKNDNVESKIPTEVYIDELDEAFKKDFGFGLKDFVNLQQVLALWAMHSNIPEFTHYFSTTEEISKICLKEIKEYDQTTTQKILDFLTLVPEEILKIKDDPNIANDVPIWEHNKRLARFDLRPLIKIKDKYYWGPHSTERSSRIWIGISGKHKFPSELNAPTVKGVLDRGHKDLENNLVLKTEEIALRFSKEVKTDLFLHKLDNSIENIGDCDVLVYLKDQNILLNIESKIIDAPHSAKDSGRVQRKIFGEIRTEGSFKKGYLQRVEERANYLKVNGSALMAKLGWSTPPSSPKVVSLFVTKIGFWWTKHPPISTDVNFVEIRMLDDFIKKLNE